MARAISREFLRPPKLPPGSLLSPLRRPGRDASAAHARGYFQSRGRSESANHVVAERRRKKPNRAYPQQLPVLTSCCQCAPSDPATRAHRCATIHAPARSQSTNCPRPAAMLSAVYCSARSTIERGTRYVQASVATPNSRCPRARCWSAAAPPAQRRPRRHAESSHRTAAAPPTRTTTW